MDPISAIGLVSSVITFIDFGYELISAAREVRASASGTTSANDHIEFLNTRMEAVASDLKVANSSPVASADRRLTDLADKCLQLSNDLKKLLDKLRAKNPKSKRQVLSSIVKNVRKKDEKKELEARLDQCRQLLHLQLSQSTRLESLSRLEEIAQTGKCHDKELRSLNHQLAILKDAVAGLNPQSKLQDEARTVLELSDLAVSKVLQNSILEALSKETMRYLKTWSGNHELIFASFFFWKHGSEEQRSLPGLLRSLLFSVLEQQPHLTRTVFPAQWDIVDVVSGKRLHFSWSEIQDAFRLLTQTPEVYIRHKFAFFVDGLDEFEGHDEKLIKTLFQWAHSGSENIKICVSSRELPIFQQRFSECLKFRLHEVTHRDIFLFVYDTLRENEDVKSRSEPREVADLGRSLVARAEGVFLWVSLAVRMLEQGLLQEESFKDLKRSIDILPLKIEQLFRVIFDSIMAEPDPFKRRRAMRFLSLGVDEREITECSGRLFLTHLSFIDDYDHDPDFGNHMNAERQIDAKDRELRLSRCKKQVTGACRGLLSINSSASFKRFPARDLYTWLVHDLERLVRVYYKFKRDPDIEILSAAISQLRQLVGAEEKSIWEVHVQYWYAQWSSRFGGDYHAEQAWDIYVIRLSTQEVCTLLPLVDGLYEFWPTALLDDRFRVAILQNVSLDLADAGINRHWGPEKYQTHSSILVNDNEDDDGFLALVKRHNWSVSLEEITYFWFAPHANMFRKIFELYRNTSEISTESLKVLRQELGFDPECWHDQSWVAPRCLLQGDWETAILRNE
ncbi:hypothetical protein DHEL01_v209263 [Diaporthe helianthi]|uniref:NACHT domain-containing protein n=1 Tax=Diaporthe helianthi TaxID=158607 RepID=A0A2P5HQ07_DIAHE|nr:hypothetical protein DHEL01_v209263 [Diaporthe helianthi]